MGEVSTIGLDIAKAVFQVHGVDGAGTVVIRKRISRSKMLEFFADLPPCLVGIEACPSAHHWGRELVRTGHTVKLMPPSYVKAYLKRSKNDANDAAAICEAVTRPSMRFVPTKTKEQQTALMLHRTRQLLVRQRTMLSNALRGHLAELGVVAPRAAMERRSCLGSSRMVRITGFLHLPAAFSMCWRGSTARFGAEIGSIDKSILTLHRSCEASRRLAEIPGIGPVVATALVDRSGMEGVCIGAQPCRLDRVGAEAAYDRRQGQARQRRQAGQPIPAMVARRRRDGRHSLRTKARDPEAAVAGSINRSPADQGGGGRPRQQDRADGLGHHGSRRQIPRADAIAGGITSADG